MTIQQLRALIQARAKEVRDLMASTDGKVWTTENQTQYDACMAAIEDAKAQINRIEKMQATLADTDFDGQMRDIQDSAEKKGNHQRAMLAKWMRTDDRELSAKDWTEIRATMSTTTGSEGGYTVQTDVAKVLLDALKDYGGMRRVSTVLQTSMGNDINWAASDGTAEEGEQVDQNATASDDDIDFTFVPMKVFKYSSKVVPIPIELLQDAMMDIETYINTRLATRLGRITNKKFTIGTGSGEPNGAVTASVLGVTGASGQTVTVTYDDIIDLIHSVDVAYRESGKCAFMMNDLSLAKIRKIKDSTGRPIFLPDDTGLADAPDGTILGYPVENNNSVATMAANAKSILFGDFSKYTIRDVMDITYHRFDDSAYAKKGQRGFLAFLRSGGNLLDVGGCIKHYKNAAS